MAEPKPTELSGPENTTKDTKPSTDAKKPGMFVAPGKLKLKGSSSGAVKTGRVEKKHKKKAAQTASAAQQQPMQEQPRGPPSKTAAELSHEARRARIEQQRAGREGKKTYDERKVEYRQKLDRLPDHNDMPKIGPG